MRPVLRWTTKLLMLTACVVAGTWLGGRGQSLLSSLLDADPPSRADNSRYFDGHNSEVVLFGTATCVYCEQTRQLLDRLDVDYHEHRIDASDEARALFQTLDAPGVPVLLVGDRRIYGFHEEEIRSATKPANDG